MARKRTLVDSVKVTLNLHREDYERMKALYPTNGAAVAIRALVRQHIQSVDKRLAASRDALVPELDLEVEDV
jgi:hypothetical protein